MVEGPRDAALGVSALSACFCVCLRRGGANLGIGMRVGLMVLEYGVLGLHNVLVIFFLSSV